MLFCGAGNNIMLINFHEKLKLQKKAMERKLLGLLVNLNVMAGDVTTRKNHAEKSGSKSCCSGLPGGLQMRI